MDIQKTALRLPRDLHDLVIESSRLSGRSMNAEIIARLRATFDGDYGALKFELSEKINNLGEKTEYVTREEVEAIVRQALKDAGVIG